jgi:hypothetical protein
MESNDTKPLAVHANPGATYDSVMAQFRRMHESGAYRARVAANGMVLVYSDGRQSSTRVYNHPVYGDACGQLRANHVVWCCYDSPVG